MNSLVLCLVLLGTIACGRAQSPIESGNSNQIQYKLDLDFKGEEIQIRKNGLSWSVYVDESHHNLIETQLNLNRLPGLQRHHATYRFFNATTWATYDLIGRQFPYPETDRFN